MATFAFISVKFMEELMGEVYMHYFALLPICFEIVAFSPVGCTHDDIGLHS